MIANGRNDYENKIPQSRKNIPVLRVCLSGGGIEMIPKRQAPPTHTHTRKHSARKFLKRTAPAIPKMESVARAISRGAMSLSFLSFATSILIFRLIPLLLSRMPERLNETEAEQWFDCDAVPYTEQACRYITHHVMGGMFHHYRRNPRPVFQEIALQFRPANRNLKMCGLVLFSAATQCPRHLYRRTPPPPLPPRKPGPRNLA